MTKNTANSKQRKPLRQVWAEKDVPQIDNIIKGLLSNVRKKYELEQEEIKLEPRKEKQLGRKMKNAESARGRARRAMIALAKYLGVSDPDNAVFIADMKDMHRAIEKSLLEDRNMNDLGRGRMFVRSLEPIIKLREMLNPTKNQTTKRFNKLQAEAFRTDKVRFELGSDDDYLKKPRKKSGYGGGFHVNFIIKVGQTDEAGFEAQLMPHGFEDAYEHSHHIFELLRLFEYIPEVIISEEQKIIRDSLKRANQALFDEEMYRWDFEDYRDEPYEPITDKQHTQILDILDRVSVCIDNLEDRVIEEGQTIIYTPDQKWRKAVKDAIVYTKTSVTNLNIEYRISTHQDYTN